MLEYRKIIKSIINFYTKLIALGTPIAGLIGYWLYFRNTEIYGDLLEKGFWMVTGIILAIGLGLSLIGLISYRLTSELVYGKYICKLDDIIHDMQELVK